MTFFSLIKTYTQIHTNEKPKKYLLNVWCEQFFFFFYQFCVLIACTNHTNVTKFDQNFLTKIIYRSLRSCSNGIFSFIRFIISVIAINYDSIQWKNSRYHQLKNNTFHKLGMANGMPNPGMCVNLNESLKFYFRSFFSFLFHLLLLLFILLNVILSLSLSQTHTHTLC